MRQAAADFIGFPSFTDPQDAVYAAIRDDNLVALERLVASGSALGLVDAEFIQDPGCAAGWGTPLHFASWSGSVDAVRILLKAGADPNFVCMISIGYGYSACPLYLAIQEGHRGIVKTLWEASAKPEMKWNPVQFVSPCIAARAGHAAIVQDLFLWHDWGRDMELAVLKEATSRWRFTVVDTLLGIVSYQSEHLHTVLHDAVSFRQEYDNERYPDPKPLEYLEQQLVIERLVEAGANPDFVLLGQSPLISAALWAPNSLGALKTLLKNGAEPNSQDEYGNTALHILANGVDGHCVLTGTPTGWHSAAIRLMLQYGANPNLANAQGVTALQLSAQYAPDPSDFEAMLMASVGSIAEYRMSDFSTGSNESLLHFAALGGKGDTMEVLISSYGMDVNAKTQTGWTPLMFALLPKTHETENSEGLGTLHEAVRAAKFLLSCGADPLVTSERGWTPLHVLSLHLDEYNDGEAKAFTLELIQRGCSINPSPALALAGKWHAMSDHFRCPQEQDRWQELPLLHWAVMHGAVDVVEALLESGADVSERDMYEHTAREVAEESSVLREKYYPGPIQKLGAVGEKMVEVLDRA